jgi:hypothetical protein
LINAVVAHVLLYTACLREKAVSAQTNRKSCRSACASVRLKNQKKKTEQEEEKYGCNNNKKMVFMTRGVMINS